MNKKGYTVLELFSGAGGLALGLHKAGFVNVGMIDFFEDANRTVRYNFPDWNVVTADINKVADEGINNYIPKQSIDLLAGGFPCQPFSYAGKKLGLEDTRGTAFYSLISIINQVAPTAIFLENVRGLLSHDQGRTFNTIIKILRDIGYYISYRVLNAWDYGVAQKRERVIIIGWREEYNNVFFQFPRPIPNRLVLRDVLQNVPDSEGIEYAEKKKTVMQMVPPGGCWVDLPDEVAKEYMGKSYYSGGGKRGMARRMAWDEPSLTLTCSPAQKQTERCHPEETRPFTTREYARIQGFPDDYHFVGSVNSIYKQIGNAVPVQLAYHIGIELKELLINIEKGHRNHDTTQLGYTVATAGGLY